MHPVRVHRYHSTDLQKLHCIILVMATDPACGSGSLLIRAIDAAPFPIMGYGQEKEKYNSRSCEDECGSAS